MLGSFHEVSVHSGDIVVSLAFYQALGFKTVETGDVWEHAYAVVSDGDIVIGLHQHEFDSPAVTFVRPDLVNYVHLLKRLNIKLAFQKLADDEFNELGFADPSGIIITLLEARTHAFSDENYTRSLCGRYLEVTLSVDDVGAAAEFWTEIGFSETGRTQSPHPAARLRRESLRIGLHQTPCPRALSFIGNDLLGRREFLQAQGFTPHPDTPLGSGAELISPEGLPLYLFEHDWLSD